MNQLNKILVASTEQKFSEEIKSALKGLPYDLTWAESSVDCLKKLKEEEFALAIIDSEVKDLPVEKLLKKGWAKSPSTEFIIGLKERNEQKKQLLIDAGADELIFFPAKGEEIRLKINEVLKEKEFLQSCGLVGKSEQLKKVAESVLQVAPTNITVLITGESGTGKELVARAIHSNSLRKGKPFVVVNTSALAEGVLESELFGHEKGSFTGAIAKKMGVFERAEKGTIFLDEIGEISPSTQVKLLRILEEKNFMRVGGTEDLKADVRILAATNRNLEQAVREGDFRSDLFFRLSVVKIELPPLRQRPKDIPVLLLEYIRRLNQESDRKIKGITDEALELLLNYHWPGNVRELKNFLESMSVLTPNSKIEVADVKAYLEKQTQKHRGLPVKTGKVSESAEHQMIYQAILALRNEILNLRQAMISPKDFPSDWKRDSLREVTPPASIEEMEKELIETILKQVGGNRKKAAKILGIGERTLYRKIDKYNLRK
jgi:DNA-binding NtrC family response regulator